MIRWLAKKVIFSIFLLFVVGFIAQYFLIDKITGFIENVEYETAYEEDDDYEEDSRKDNNFIYDDYRTESDW